MEQTKEWVITKKDLEDEESEVVDDLVDFLINLTNRLDEEA